MNYQITAEEDDLLSQYFLQQAIDQKLRQGTLASELVSFFREEYSTLPEDDYDCRREIQDSMELFFKLTNQTYRTPSFIECRGDFLTFVTIHTAKTDTLRDVLMRYTKETNCGLSLLNDQNCRATVDEGMNYFFAITEGDSNEIHAQRLFERYLSRR